MSAVRTVVTNGLVLDTATMSFRDEAAVVIEDGVIVDVPDQYEGTAGRRGRCAGCFVLPGLIDAHVHLRIASMDVDAMRSWTEVEHGIHMATLARRTVERGVHDRARPRR